MKKENKLENFFSSVSISREETVEFFFFFFFTRIKFIIDIKLKQIPSVFFFLQIFKQKPEIWFSRSFDDTTKINIFLFTMDSLLEREEVSARVSKRAY